MQKEQEVEIITFTNLHKAILLGVEPMKDIIDEGTRYRFQLEVTEGGNLPEGFVVIKDVLRPYRYPQDGYKYFIREHPPIIGDA